MHRRVPVAAEGRCRDEGERSRDSRQSVLEALVERRAPEGVPPAVAVVEMRMHEPLGNRAARQLDDGEDPACAVSERERGGGRLREPKELADVDPPGRHLGARDLGASRQTDANLVVRERAGGVAGERDARRRPAARRARGSKRSVPDSARPIRVGARHDSPSTLRRPVIRSSCRGRPALRPSSSPRFRSSRGSRSAT